MNRKKHWRCLLSLTSALLISSLLTGCWTQLKYGEPIYVHPPQSKPSYLITEKMVYAYAGTSKLTGGYLEFNAAKDGQGNGYYQITHSREYGGPATILLPYTVENTHELQRMFSTAYKMVKAGKDHGLKFPYRSLGCLGPKKGEVNCERRGSAFYDGQMHLAISSERLPYARLRVVESQWDKNKIYDLTIFNDQALKDVLDALMKVDQTFTKLDEKMQKLQLTDSDSLI